MEREEDIKDELNRIASGIPEKDPVRPPAGYFESFPERIVDRWKNEESHPVHRTIIWRNALAMAAVLVAVLIGGWWFFIQKDQQVANEITAIEAYQYIQENFDEFESLIEAEPIIIEETNANIPSEEVQEFLLDELEGQDPEDIF